MYAKMNFSTSMRQLLVLLSVALIAVESYAQNCTDGEAFKRYSISNTRGMRAEFIPFGGTLTHLFFPDNKGVSRDIILGWDDPTEYCKNPQHPYFGALIGRYANRIANGTFELNDKIYETSRNDNNNTLHGGTIGFDRRVWKIVQLSPSILQLTLFSEDGDMGFPGNLSVKVIYEVTEEDEWIINYFAESSADTIINLSDHTYWNLDAFIDGHETVLGQTLMINADTYVEVDALLIPTGKIGQVAVDYWLNFNQPKLIGKDIANGTATPTGGYDNAWILKNDQPKRPAALLFSNFTGIKLELFTTQPSLQFYSGNFLSGTIPKKQDQSYGKPNQFYQKYSCVVLETQHYPDSIHHPSWPTTILRARQPYSHQAIFALSSFR